MMFTRAVSLIFAGMVAASPAVAQDPLGVGTAGGGPIPVVEGLLGTAIVVSSCPAPVSSGVGLTFDGSHLWLSDFSTRRAYRIDPNDCSIVSSIPLPGQFPTGLAWDGTFLWNSDSDSDAYYQIDPSDGTVISSFASPGIWPSGLTYYDGNLWGADIGCVSPVCPDRIDQVDGLGTVENSFSPPGPFPAGLASDGVYFWHSDNNLDMVFKLDPADFSVLDQFPAPGDQTNDLAWDGRYLWAIDNRADMLHKLDVGVPPLPRSQGFWKHQCSDKGYQQVTAAELSTLFADIESASAVFSECGNVGCERFENTGPKKETLPKLLTHLQVLWLNIASERLSLDAEIDLSDLTSATTVGDAIGEIEASACDPSSSRGELEEAKNIAELLSNIDHDFDLGAGSSVVSLQAGESGSVTIGIINMSLLPSSYDLVATGPWPVQLSETRVNALQPGGIALVTVSSEAPDSATPGSTARVTIFAKDRDNQIDLQRDLTITFRVPGGGAGGSKRMLPTD